jgi:hypothetical protein
VDVVKDGDVIASCVVTAATDDEAKIRRHSLPPLRITASRHLRRGNASTFSPTFSASATEAM